MINPTENWKPVIGYEGLYEISNKGLIRSIDRVIQRNGASHRIKGRILSIYTDNLGYQRITLSKEGKLHTMCIHKLVAEAFIPNPENKPCIDHIDTNPSNNCVDNLRWCTHSENMNNSVTLQHLKECRITKPVLQYDLKDNFIAEYISGREAARQVNIQQASLVRCLQGTQKTAGGYKWRYKND